MGVEYMYAVCGGRADWRLGRVRERGAGGGRESGGGGERGVGVCSKCMWVDGAGGRGWGNEGREKGKGGGGG